jgi:hypothetical protein
VAVRSSGGLDGGFDPPFAALAPGANMMHVATTTTEHNNKPRNLFMLSSSCADSSR